MGANLYIANTATLILIGLQLMVPSYVGAVENSPLSMMTSIVEQAYMDYFTVTKPSDIFNQEANRFNVGIY